MSGKIRRLVALDIAIFIVLALFLVIAIVSYYHRPEIKLGYSYSMVKNGTLLNIYTNETSQESTFWDLAFNFTTHDVFSAQTELDIDAIATVNDDNPHYDVRVLFPTAFSENIYYERGHAAAAAINLTQSETDPRTFTGSGTLTYRDEGDKCIFVTEQALVVETRYPLCSENGTSLIHISSADSKLQFETNKILISLAWVAAGLTFVVVRQLIAKFGKHW